MIFVVKLFMLIQMNENGRNSNLFVTVNISLNGYSNIFNPFRIIFFIVNIILTLHLIIYLLNDNMYRVTPNSIPKKMYNLISPLLYVNMKYKVIKPVSIQNTKSSIYVTISDVLNVFREILNMSNNKPIIIPFKINIINVYACFSNTKHLFLFKDFS